MKLRVQADFQTTHEAESRYLAAAKAEIKCEFMHLTAFVFDAPTPDCFLVRKRVKDASRSLRVVSLNAQSAVND